MKRKIAILITIAIAAAAVAGMFAGCTSAITAEEGVQAVMDAVAASKAFYTEYDAAQGYSYYIKQSGKSEDGSKTETVYLSYKKGNEDMEWNDFVMAKYTKTVSDAASSVTTSEYFGDVLPKDADDAKENYVRALVDNNYAVKALTEEEFLALPEVSELTLPYLMSLFDNLDKEDIVVKEGGATVAGAVTTVRFSVSDKSVPLSAYGEVIVRVTNDKISSIEAKQNATDDDEDLVMDYTLVYSSPNMSMPTSYIKDNKTVEIDYAALA